MCFPRARAGDFYARFTFARINSREILRNYLTIFREGCLLLFHDFANFESDKRRQDVRIFAAIPLSFEKDNFKNLPSTAQAITSLITKSELIT